MTNTRWLTYPEFRKTHYGVDRPLEEGLEKEKLKVDWAEYVEKMELAAIEEYLDIKKRISTGQFVSDEESDRFRDFDLNMSPEEEIQVKIEINKSRK